MEFADFVDFVELPDALCFCEWHKAGAVVIRITRAHHNVLLVMLACHLVVVNLKMLESCQNNVVGLWQKMRLCGKAYAPCFIRTSVRHRPGFELTSVVIIPAGTPVLLHSSPRKFRNDLQLQLHREGNEAARVRSRRCPVIRHRMALVVPPLRMRWPTSRMASRRVRPSRVRICPRRT